MSKKRRKKKHNTTAKSQQIPPITTPPPFHVTEKQQTIIIVLFLSIATFAVYNNVLRYDFAYYDDEYYITTNIHIQQGFSWEGVKWAFTSVGYADNWHPLTWLSHMLDVQFFGLNPAGHHFTNLLFHIVASLFLFGFLNYATKKLWISATVAALFALHPTHVESVAWVSERKDVLSALFWFATMWAYVYYTRKPSIGRYTLVLFLFALGLLSKPMLVSLPVVLLLIDYWPADRLTMSVRELGIKIVEKLPLFAMASVSSIFTIIAQKGALSSKIIFSARVLNAITSYCVYIGQAFWPAKLAVLYPFTRPNPVNVVLCSILLVIITGTVLWFGREKKYLITGWFWFIVSLIPVIGIVQVGSQAHADRYTYIPFVGIFIMSLYGIHESMYKMSRRTKNVAEIVFAFILLALSIKTRDQTKYWKNGQTLFSHTLEITKGNAIAHYNLGNIFREAGRIDKAINQYRKALEIKPDHIQALGNLAGAYYTINHFREAVPLMERVLALVKAKGDESQVKDVEDNIELLRKAIEYSEKTQSNKNAEP